MEKLQEILKYTKDLVNQEPEKSAFWHYNKLVGKIEEAIDVIHCSKLLPDELQPVLAKIKHTNSLGTSNYWEVVYFDNENWHSYSGSKTFEDGEKVVKWTYCKAIV